MMRLPTTIFPSKSSFVPMYVLLQTTVRRNVVPSAMNVPEQTITSPAKCTLRAHHTLFCRSTGGFTSTPYSSTTLRPRCTSCSAE